MRLWEKFANLFVGGKLTLGKGASIVVTNSDLTTSTINLTELAALDSIAASDLAKIDSITNGTAAAGKALVLGASKEIATITSATITTLTAPNMAGSVTFTDGTTDVDMASHDGTNGLKLGGTLVTSSAAELNYNDIATLGTLAASKAWTSDASLDTVMPTVGLLTVQSGGAVTLSSGSTLTLSGGVVQAPVFVADAAPYAVLAADSGRLHIILEQASSITLNLPVIAAGLSYKFVMGGVATEAQNWVIVATTPSFYNGGVSWDDSNAVASPVPVYGNGTSHLTLTATTPEAGTAIEIYSNGTEWFVCGAVFSTATPAFT